VREISSSKLWKQGWTEEIIARVLTVQALASEHEGFAEFGKVMYAGDASREWLEKYFPRWVEVWRGHGIW
jgi:hypothetical protein